MVLLPEGTRVIISAANRAVDGMRGTIKQVRGTTEAGSDPFRYLVQTDENYTGGDGKRRDAVWISPLWVERETQ